MEEVSNIIPIRNLSSSLAKKIIKEIVEQGKIKWSLHCKERMLERKISIQEIVHCLLKGIITEGPFYSHKNGGVMRSELRKSQLEES